MSEHAAELRRGEGALVISVPHVGTELPPALAARLTDAGRTLIDTDWYVDRLYPFARDLDATVLCARWSRYLVDVNRDPSGASLYPGQRTTSVCPIETFEGQPLYAAGDEPGAAEIAQRCAGAFEPYHAALRAELERVRALHGYVVLLDAHSIWGRLPLLFEGELPDLNLGTNDGRSLPPRMRESARVAAEASTYSVVLDGRFKGGFITRSYGKPADGVYAIQIELNQRTYLADGSRTAWDDAKAARLSRVLHRVCQALLASAATLTHSPTHS
ncbi:MAG TPA: N-formylglutamate deformylase [Candidatus Sulfotelmatobacter sp.]|nr:N-formylglutamate deformylase [Candidatus Sulfotelmatobacter sp.]